MAFVDFAAVKEAVSFSDAISYLELDLKKAGNQHRGPCPACGTGGDRALVLTEGRGWYCFADKKGGDVIGLVSHIRGVSVKDAAQFLAEHAGMVQVSTSTSTKSKVPVPESEAAGSKLQPLSYLECVHDAVIALGFDPDFCERHGIGYAPKGVVRGSVAIPFRDEHGALLGYFGVQELTYIPADFQPSNVVPLKRA